MEFIKYKNIYFCNKYANKEKINLIALIFSIKTFINLTKQHCKVINIDLIYNTNYFKYFFY